MIQRKQTLYLFLAGLVTIVLLFIPFGNISTDLAYFKYTAFAVREATPDNTFILSTLGIALLLIASSGLSFNTIFFYKNRKIQLQLISINMLVILVAICAIMYIYPNLVFPKNINLANAKLEYNPIIVISFISAFGLFLAKKAITKDEAMIRSADRLR